jgi:DNA-binding transcriptional LysR family regulator
MLNFKSHYDAIIFQHLFYAIAAADHGSFRAAAETLMIQQTTLSRCIRQLEHTIGTPVFDRYSGGVRETRFGQRFLRVQGASLSRSTVL